MCPLHPLACVAEPSNVEIPDTDGEIMQTASFLARFIDSVWMPHYLHYYWTHLIKLSHTGGGGAPCFRDPLLTPLLIQSMNKPAIMCLSRHACIYFLFNNFIVFNKDIIINCSREWSNFACMVQIYKRIYLAISGYSCITIVHNF